MASSSWVSCGPCEYRHETQEADVWCSVCEEGLCRSCHGHHSVIKSTRDHELMLIKAHKILAKGMLSVNMECNLHNEKFELYCPSHEIHCCVHCVITQHKHCTGVTSLRKVIQNIKGSTSLSNIKSNLKDRLLNIDGLIKNGTDNFIGINTDKDNVKRELKKLRMSIENKLDILETKILTDVDSIQHQHKTCIADIVSKLQRKRDALNQALIDFENLQKNASDFHIYMAMKKLETDLLQEGKEINSLLLQEGMKLKRVYFSPNADLLSSVSDTTFLGNVAVRTSLFPLLKEVNTNAQISSKVSAKNIISVQLKRRLSGYQVYEGEDVNISSIIVLPDRNILIADFGDDGGILLFSESGNFITKMTQFGKPYGTALIDDYRIALSFPKNRNIKILKLGSRISLIKTFQLDVDLNAISYYGTHISVCSRPQSVLFVDLNGVIAKRLDLELPYACITFIHCHSNRML
ncbi:unnamed protein product [Mytilus edulis]|uniref:B box-type domain-containing protein n=1 Tax=Mytilus edulis TaxID=6550 RepID=A0A8S3R254_MYTED|nr:unnamed protein product [Mytilus edulis]